MSFIIHYNTPNTADEDLQLGVQNLQHGWLADALLIASRQCQQLAHSALPFILLATVLQKAYPHHSPAIWLAVWRKHPLDPHIQSALLNALRQANKLSELDYYARMFLPDRGTREEQLSLGQQLLQLGNKRLGLCRLHDNQIQLMVMASGQAVPYSLTVKNCLNGEVLTAQSACYNQPFELPLTDKPGVWDIRFSDSQEAMVGSPLANYQTLHQAIAPLPSRPDNPHCQITIVIPVYKSYELAVACIHSVCQTLAANHCKAEVLVINDSADGKNLRKLLNKQAQSLVRIINHDSNSGFIESVNHGIALSAAGSHILLLNADTLVSGNWLDRLSDSLNQAPDIASVSPLSNNGEVSSIPQIGKAAPMPDDKLLRQINQQLGQLRDAGESQDIPAPAVCGFCMLIRREVLDKIGGLDGKAIRRGYSEEVDWCLRASHRGYRHLLATAVYVAHAGGASFSNEKQYLVARHRQLILQRYPDYYDDYFAFLDSEPLAELSARLETRLGKQLPRPVSKDKHELLKLPAIAALNSRQHFIALDLQHADDDMLNDMLALCRQLAHQAGQIHCIILGHAPKALLNTGITTVLRPEHRGTVIREEDLLQLLGCRLLISSGGVNLPGRTIRYAPYLGTASWLAHIDNAIGPNTLSTVNP